LSIQKALKLIFDLLIRIINKFWVTVYLFRIQLDSLIPLPFDSRFRMEPLTQSDLDQIRIHYKKEVGNSTLAKLGSTLSVDSSVKCYLVFYNSQIAGYYHIAFSDTLESRTRYKISLSSDAVYFFKDYTFKKFRGKKIHLFSIQGRILTCRNSGYKEALVCIYKSNYYSLKSYSKMGFKPKIKIFSFWFFFIRKNFIYTVI